MTRRWKVDKIKLRMGQLGNLMVANTVLYCGFAITPQVHTLCQCASAPRGLRNTIELYRENLTEGTLELWLSTGQDLNRFILKMYCQLRIQI